MAADLLPVPVERRFRAMGSDAHVIVVGADVDLIERAATRIADLERRWSRFSADSETSAMTRANGAAVTVSSDTILLVERAIEAWHITGGSFDPTVLGDVIRAGYDRSFEDVAAGRPGRRTAIAGLQLAGCADIEVIGATVRLPPHAGFDPGGIGKGLAADIVVDELMAGGALGACVNLGGDLRVAGVGPDREGWTIGIDHVWTGKPLALVGIGAGAVATSTTLKRSWVRDGRVRHHLIEPTTGEPSESDLNHVSVIAAEAWMAEVLAKAVLLRGSATAFDIIDTSHVQALTVDVAGRIRTTAGFSSFIDKDVPSHIAPPRTEEKP